MSAPGIIATMVTTAKMVVMSILNPFAAHCAKAITMVVKIAMLVGLTGNAPMNKLPEAASMAKSAITTGQRLVIAFDFSADGIVFIFGTCASAWFGYAGDSLDPSRN